VGRFRGVLQRGHLVGDVTGELHHLVQTTFGVEQRVVRGFEINHLPGLVLALETVRVIFAAIERRPERLVLRRFGFGTVTEHAVVMADDFVERVLHGFQKVVVGGNHIAFRGELDHRHRTADRREHAFFFVLFVDPGGDVRRHFDHTFDLFVRAVHRHVTGFQPDLLAGLVQAQKRAADRLTPGQVAPQFGVLLAAVKRFFAKHPVMFSPHFLGAVTHGLAEVFVGIQNNAFGGKFDHRHRTADRFELGVGFGQGAAETLDFLQVSLVM